MKMKKINKKVALAITSVLGVALLVLCIFGIGNIGFNDFNSSNAASFAQKVNVSSNDVNSDVTASKVKTESSNDVNNNFATSNVSSNSENTVIDTDEQSSEDSNVRTATIFDEGTFANTNVAKTNNAFSNSNNVMLGYKIEGDTLSIGNEKEGFISFDSGSGAPWVTKENLPKIKHVKIVDHITPTTTIGWFGCMITPEEGTVVLTNIVDIQNLDNLDMSNVTDASYLFIGSDFLKDPQVSDEWFTKLSNVHNAFGICAFTKTLSNTFLNKMLNAIAGSVTNASLSFSDNPKLTSVTFENKDTAMKNATNTSFMFYRDDKLTNITSGNLISDGATDVTGMFAKCHALTTITLDSGVNWNNMSTLISSNRLFEDCTSLIGGNGTTFSTDHVNKEYARIDGSGTLGYFTEGSRVAHKVTVNVVGIGSASADPSEAVKDTTIQLHQKQTDPDYVFKGWSSDPEVEIFDDDTFVMPDYDVTITATFERHQTEFKGLKFTSLEDGNEVQYINNDNNKPDIKYSFDGINWTQWEAGSLVTINTYEFIYIKGDNSNGFSKDDSCYSYFSTTKKFDVSGNVNSLLDDSDGSSVKSIPKYCYYNLFNSSKLKSITGILLPATELGDNCYNSMFSKCTSLESIPEGLLSATKLADSCYEAMFFYCTSLTSIPEGLLPATELANYCYKYMFFYCTSLESIPEGLLSATKLANYCYNSMFSGCSNLTSIPGNLLLATTLADGCYEYMFSGCSNLTSIPEGLLPATKLADSCYEYMFYACSNLTSIPEGLLRATELADYCYGSMFYGCSNLTSIPGNLLLVTTLAESCYSYMFSGCTSLTSIPEGLLRATELASNCYSYMFGDCTSLTSIPEGLLPATTLATSCYSYMFYGCEKLNISETNGKELIFVCSDGSCCNNMFSNTGGSFQGTPETGKSYFCN